ncbi:MAG: alanine dehydrogenase [Bacteroidetes bacterium]|nr:alanine dehydrogenase [Bacteroidota bacterium]MBV6462471.1 Alanine dehydrogenase 2 [Flavobacteriales bacterium]WKZ74363.1 MAG: alanine dehydrogenase [Vicingaceae bacterium]MCL4817017.1 alanine dehydrogenase [Flavobacteriales bacterium]NOG94696.1 alanine dehydrogenase [Bacteroidota bacterium]
MTPNDDVLKSLAKSFMPQPEMLEVARKKSDLYIGIPKETSFQEKRVALTPSAVALLVNRGHEVVIETQAGKGANFEDHDYSEAGARITYSPEDVYKANIILKVEPPSHTEIEMMQMGQTLISALQLPIQPKNFLKKLIEKKITAIAFDYIMDEEKTFPVIRSMSEIAGTTSILIAAEYLSNVNSGQGLMLGGISGVPPIEVVILGAGTVGEYATRAAIGLGASVKVFDNNIYKLRRLQNVVNQRVYTSVVSPHVLKKALQTADVAIGAIRAPQGRTPCIVTEDMVKDMKNGAIVVDVSIDQGGCFETSEVTSHEKPTFKKYGVIHYGVPNIASRVAKTASSALSHVFSPMLLDIADDGGVEECLKKDFGIRQGIYLFKGILSNKYLGETFNLPYKDIDLLIAAYK